jgi:hypothetical protein
VEPGLRLKRYYVHGTMLQGTMESTMPFQWLQMRIQEETERRELQAKHVERMPAALQEIHGYLAQCIQAYTENFGADSASIALLPDRVQVTVREERDGKWQRLSKVEVISVPDMPGFRVERGEFSMAVEFGLLPNDKLFYLNREQGTYLTMEEFTKRILDRALFPALPEG